MLYHVSREGQVYGPYTLEDLERYLQSGNVLPTDLARAEGSEQWVPVSQVVPGAASGPVAPSGLAPGAVPPGDAAGGHAAGVSPYPDPPNLNWGLVLLFGIVTCGLFIIVWDLVQAVWMRRVNPRSNALFLYIAGDVVNVFGSTFRFTAMLGGGLHAAWWGFPIGLVTLVLIELARFDMKRSLEEHYNGPEPIGLVLGPVMTFFFGSLYFQYHMTRINEMKRIARYRTGVL